MIYMKADDEMVKNNLNSINQVLQDHEQAFSALQKHIEAMQKALAKIFSMLNELSVQSGSALISRKSWAPLNCLSCGRGDTGYLPPLPTIQGADGRMYQADTVTLKSNMSASMTELPKVELEPSYHEFQGSNVSPGLKDPLKGSLRAPLSVVIGKEAKVVFRSEKSKNRPQSARVNN